MSKPFPYWVRLIVVASLSVALSFNSAFAEEGSFAHCGGGPFRMLSSCPAPVRCAPAPLPPPVVDMVMELRS